jgi:prophage regulatory protein
MNHEAHIPRGMRMLTTGDVLARRNVSRAKLYRDIALGEFPMPVKDGAKTLFIEHEVDEWMTAQAAKRPARTPRAAVSEPAIAEGIS